MEQASTARLYYSEVRFQPESTVFYEENAENANDNVCYSEHGGDLTVYITVMILLLRQTDTIHCLYLVQAAPVMNGSRGVQRVPGKSASMMFPGDGYTPDGMPYTV